MSSQASPMTPKGGQSSSTEEKRSAPIEILRDDYSRIYSHLHPLLLVSQYLAQFRLVVADPISALLGGLLPLGALQFLYLLLCLPAPVARSTTGPPKSKAGHRSKVYAKKDEVGMVDKIVPASLSLLLALFFGAPVVAIALVLMGAPFTTHQWQTLLCATHMSLLSGMPLVYVHGVDGSKWREIASLATPFDHVFGAAVGTMLGAWIGAIPIPLDWDRDWQKWPITVVTGAYLGCAVGSIVGGSLLRGKRIELV